MGLYDDVYTAFEAADVRYVVVGGMAVVLELLIAREAGRDR